MVAFLLEALLKDNGCYILCKQNFNHKYTKVDEKIFRLKSKKPYHMLYCEDGKIGTHIVPIAIWQYLVNFHMQN